MYSEDSLPFGFRASCISYRVSQQTSPYRLQDFVVGGRLQVLELTSSSIAFQVLGALGHTCRPGNSIRVQVHLIVTKSMLA